MRLIVNPQALAKKVSGVVTIPGDKSISHRALLLGSIANGISEFTNLLVSADTLATRNLVENLGSRVVNEGGSITVNGRGLANFSEPPNILEMGNSGTTTRLGLGLVGPSNIFAVFSGDSSLQKRPMDRVIKPLSALGLTFTARAGNSRPPIVCLPSQELHPGRFIGTVPSAQVKSAYLLAAIQIVGTSEYIEPVLTRDHTERMLAAAGAELVTNGTSIKLTGGRPLQPLQFRIPGDPSSAAFWTVAALIRPDTQLTLRDVNINPRRIGFISVLQRMGGHIQIANCREWGGERVADLIVSSSSLYGCEITASEVPDLIDEVPILAVAAAAASGITRITGAAELRVKESDRISTIVHEFGKLGIRLIELADGLEITGNSQIIGGTVQSHHDHRIAMAALVLGLLAKTPVQVDGAEMIATSYPSFEETFCSLYGLESLQKIT